MTFWVGWRGDGGQCMAVGMILCSPSLSSVSSYKGFHSFIKSSMTTEWAKNVFLFLLVSLDVHFEVLN